MLQAVVSPSCFLTMFDSNFLRKTLETPFASGPSKSSCWVPRDIRTGGDASPSRLTLVKVGNVFKTRPQPRSCHLEASLLGN